MYSVVFVDSILIYILFFFALNHELLFSCICNWELVEWAEPPADILFAE